MKRPSAWRRYLSFWGPNFQADVQSELDFHIEMRAAEYRSRGYSAEEARTMAMRRFGDVNRARTECLDIDEKHAKSEGRARFIATLESDLAFATRIFRRQALPTLVAVVCLALGIGATTTIFTVTNAMFWRPLPFASGERLIGIATPRTGRTVGVSSLPDIYDWRTRARSFSEVAAYRYEDITVIQGEPRRVTGGLVSANVFRALGVTPEIGRVFTPDEDRPGAPKVVVVSHGFAERFLGGASRAVNAQINLGGNRHTVIGVIADAERFPDGAELWLPIAKDPAVESRGTRYLNGLGLLRPGVTLDAARREMAALGKQLLAEHPRDNVDMDILLFPLRDRWVASTKPGLVALAAASLLVLLVACANVAGLQVSRASARAREIAVRTAMGAGPARIIRQLLTESVLLATIGGALGALVAVLGTRLMANFAPTAWMTFNVDARALAFSLAVSALAGIAFGTAPALRLGRVDPSNVLRGGRPLGLVRGGLQRAFVVAEVALSLVLLVGAGFALQSVLRLGSVPLGFDPSGVATFRISLQGPRYDAAAERERAVAELAGRIAGMQDVEAVGATTRIPIIGCCSQFGTNIEGRDGDPKHPLMVTGNMITPGFFTAMRLPLIQGRTFTTSDDGGAPRVMIINETFARTYWPGGDAIGHRVDTGGGWATIVGIVGDVKQNALSDAPEPQFYRPHAQDPWEDMWFAIRVRGDNPSRVIPEVRRALRDIDPTQPVFGASTMAKLFDRALGPRKWLGGLLAGFAVLALLLAMAGVYAVMSFLVAQRTQELGVRVALGAERSQVVWLVLRQGATLAAIGAAIGLAGGILAARVLAHSLYGVSAAEPMVYVVAVAALIVTALVASAGPARRASGVDPMLALRAE